MINPEMDRRSLLKGFGVSILVLGTGAFTLTSCQVSTWPNIEALGNLYVAKVPAEGSLAALSPLLGNAAPGTMPHSLFLSRAGQISDDWTNSRVVWLNSWMYSVTEARIAAFWALRPQTTTTTTVS